MTRCAIYCRVSTKDQEEEGSSLGTQEERCRVYAAELGWKVVTVYRETHTGSELWERPQLTAVREMVREGTVDVLLAYALDRLSRKQTHISIVADECERSGAQLAFVTEDFEKSAVGTFLRSAKAFAAELEREKIAERTQRGMMARVKSGKLRPGNRPLYGYKWTDESKGAYAIDEGQAPNVRRMFALAAGGASLRRIAATLDEEGVPTANGAGRWAASVIRVMLRHPAYKGTAVTNHMSHTRVGGKQKHSTRPASDHILLPEGTIPAIVSPELFDAVDARLERNKAEATRNNRDPEAFLLRAGFVICGYCGKHVPTAWYRGRRDAPLRPSYTLAPTALGHHDCPGFSISAPALDSAV